jgi:predicted GNAT family N-acyltransferase
MGGNLLIVTAIVSEVAREHLHPMLRQLGDDAHFLGDQFSSVSLSCSENIETAKKNLGAHFQSIPEPLAILMTDASDGFGIIAGEIKEILDRHQHTSIAILPITAEEEPASDIVTVLHTRTSISTDIKKNINAVAIRLIHLQAPDRFFSARRVANVIELKSHYRLRHAVYKTLDYIGADKLTVHSAMEIDGVDRSSSHLCLFERYLGYEQIVGTARVIFMQDHLPAYVEQNDGNWTDQLLGIDGPLRAIAAREQLTNELPVFHSQDLNEELHEAICENLNCAEMSRVIVSPQYRGACLSTQLIEKCIQEASDSRVDRLYLECLDKHEKMYADHGFLTIPNKRGKVVSIGCTMIPMVLHFPLKDTADALESKQQNEART